MPVSVQASGIKEALQLLAADIAACCCNSPCQCLRKCLPNPEIGRSPLFSSIRATGTITTTARPCGSCDNPYTFDYTDAFPSLGQVTASTIACSLIAGDGIPAGTECPDIDTQFISGLTITFSCLPPSGEPGGPGDLTGRIYATIQHSMACATEEGSTGDLREFTNVPVTITCNTVGETSGQFTFHVEYEAGVIDVEFNWSGFGP